jgi:toxin ParE1/3/4
MKLVWSPLALERVADLAWFVAEDRPHAADRWVEEIFAAVERSSGYPVSGRSVPEANRKDLREVLHGSFRIIYRVEGNQVSVLTFRHTRQELEPE